MDGYIALGSNLGDRRRHLQAGLDGLRTAGVRPVAVSAVWETEPVDCPAPQWFWNMTVRVSTNRQPLDLLDLLMRIERRSGRRRQEPNGPRTLDLDLLMLGSLIVNHARLRLPHPRMWARRFVLEPLAEIASGLVNPATGRTVEQERVRLDDPSQVRRLGPLATCETLPL